MTRLCFPYDHGEESDNALVGGKGVHAVVCIGLPRLVWASAATALLDGSHTKRRHP